MFSEKKFNGVYPIFFIYFFICWFIISVLIVIIGFIISHFIILPFIFLLLLLLAWFLNKRNIRWIYFKQDELIIQSFFGFVEVVNYDNLKKFYVKHEGINNKTISTIQFLGKNNWKRTVNFRTEYLDIQLFKAQLLLHLKLDLQIKEKRKSFFDD